MQFIAIIKSVKLLWLCTSDDKMDRVNCNLQLNFNFNTNTPTEPYSGIGAEPVEINWAVSVDDFEVSPGIKDLLMLRQCLNQDDSSQ